MKKSIVVLSTAGILLAGCGSLRFAPTEAQKQNVWLHNRTTMAAAQTVQTENGSEQLKALTQLSELQSRAFISYFGLPKEFPPADTTEEILAQSNWQLARTALQESADRPDGWQLAEGVFELAIGISALLGGVYGARAVQFLKQARTKTQALREIIAGNELFKRENKGYAEAFKQAQKDQSSETRQIVAEMKVNS